MIKRAIIPESSGSVIRATQICECEFDKEAAPSHCLMVCPGSNRKSLSFHNTESRCLCNHTSSQTKWPKEKMLKIKTALKSWEFVGWFLKDVVYNSK